MFEYSLLESEHYIRKLDPRFKIISYVVLVLQITFIESIPLACLTLFPSLILLVQSKVNINEIAKRIATLNIFVVFLWFTLPLGYPGKAIFEIGFLKLSKEGILYCVLITLKCNSAFLLLFVLMGSISSPELGLALRSLGVSPKLIYLILFTWRYLSVMWKELSLMMRALKARAFEPRNSIHTYKTLAFLVGMLMIRAYERSKRVKWAMEARGFEGKYYSLRRLSFGRPDLFFLSGTIFWILLVGYLEWINPLLR